MPSRSGVLVDKRTGSLVRAYSPILTGGRSGIRTHGDPKTSTALEAVPFVRSGILPSMEAIGEGG